MHCAAHGQGPRARSKMPMVVLLVALSSACLPCVNSDETVNEGELYGAVEEALQDAGMLDMLGQLYAEEARDHNLTMPLNGTQNGTMPGWLGVGLTQNLTVTWDGGDGTTAEPLYGLNQTFLNYTQTIQIIGEGGSALFNSTLQIIDSTTADNNTGSVVNTTDAIVNISISTPSLNTSWNDTISAGDAESLVDKINGTEPAAMYSLNQTFFNFTQTNQTIGEGGDALFNSTFQIIDNNTTDSGINTTDAIANTSISKPVNTSLDNNTTGSVINTTDAVASKSTSALVYTSLNTSCNDSIQPGDAESLVNWNASDLWPELNTSSSETSEMNTSATDNFNVTEPVVIPDANPEPVFDMPATTPQPPSPPPPPNEAPAPPAPVIPPEDSSDDGSSDDGSSHDGSSHDGSSDGYGDNYGSSDGNDDYYGSYEDYGDAPGTGNWDDQGNYHDDPGGDAYKDDIPQPPSRDNIPALPSEQAPPPKPDDTPAPEAPEPGATPAPGSVVVIVALGGYTTVTFTETEQAIFISSFEFILGLPTGSVGINFVRDARRRLLSGILSIECFIKVSEHSPNQLTAESIVGTASTCSETLSRRLRANGLLRATVMDVNARLGIDAPQLGSGNDEVEKAADLLKSLTGTEMMLFAGGAALFLLCTVVCCLRCRKRLWAILCCKKPQGGYAGLLEPYDTSEDSVELLQGRW